MSLVLYSTQACHLCEQALDIIRPLLLDPHAICEVDISDHDHLIEAYGTRIPVLQDSVTGLSLAWPFERDQVLAFLTHLEQVSPAV